MAVRRRSPYLSQAQAQAIVRYSPEEQALVALLQQAHDTFHQGVSAARGAAKYTVGEINRARPELAKVYALPGGNPKQAIATPVLPAAGALDFKSASQFESQAASQRFAQSRADAMHGLTQEKTAAAAGAQFGAQQARTQYLRDLGTIDDRLVGLAGQKGAFIASTLGTLEQQAAQRAVTRRGQNITRANALTSHADRQATFGETQRHHRATEQQAARNASRSGGKNGGKPEFTRSEVHRAARTYRDGLSVLTDLNVSKGSADGAAAAKHILVSGLKSADGKTWIQKPVTTDNVLAGIIAERYAHGQLSDPTWRRLKNQYGVTGKRGQRRSPGGVILHNRKPSNAPAGGDPAGRFH